MKLWKIRSRDYIGEGTGLLYKDFHCLKIGSLVYCIGNNFFKGINTDGHVRVQVLPKSCRVRIKCTKQNLRAFAKQFK